MEKLDMTLQFVGPPGISQPMVGQPRQSSNILDLPNFMLPVPKPALPKK